MELYSILIYILGKQPNHTFNSFQPHDPPDILHTFHYHLMDLQISKDIHLLSNIKPIYKKTHHLAIQTKLDT